MITLALNVAAFLFLAFCALTLFAFIAHVCEGSRLPAAPPPPPPPPKKAGLFATWFCIALWVCFIAALLINWGRS